MKLPFIILVLVCSAMVVQAQQQGSFDMVVLRNKQGRTVKSYFSGITIEFGARDGREISGMIRKIERDTLWIQQYDIRQAMTMWGTQVQDTLSVFWLKYAYNQIVWIRKPLGPVELVRNGTIPMIGGAAYTGLHLFNAVTRGEPVIWSTVAISTGIAAAGFAMGKLRKRQYVIGRGYTLKYIDTAEKG
jgi:hypothetical protein